MSRARSNAARRGNVRFAPDVVKAAIERIRLAYQAKSLDDLAAVLGMTVGQQGFRVWMTRGSIPSRVQVKVWRETGLDPRNLFPTAEARKPRLKLRHGGGVQVVTPGSLPWCGHEAFVFVRAHYGTEVRFAKFIGVPQASLAWSVQDRNSANAGRVAFIRQVLGLRSEPGALNQKLADANARRKAARGAEATFATRPEARA